VFGLKDIMFKSLNFLQLNINIGCDNNNIFAVASISENEEYTVFAASCNLKIGC